MANYEDEDYDITEDDDWGEDEDIGHENIIKHVVMPGETDIIRICAMYGITDWVGVAEYNHIRKPNNIVAGQILYIISEDD